MNLNPTLASGPRLFGGPETNDGKTRLCWKEHVLLLPSLGVTKFRPWLLSPDLKPEKQWTEPDENENKFWNLELHLKWMDLEWYFANLHKKLQATRYWELLLNRGFCRKGCGWKGLFFGGWGNRCCPNEFGRNLSFFDWYLPNWNLLLE